MKKRALILVLILGSILGAKGQDWLDINEFTSTANFSLVGIKEAGDYTFVAGIYQAGFTINGDAIPLNGSANSFLLKMDKAGQVVWYSIATGSQIVYRDLNIDQQGNLFITGYFNGPSEIRLNGINNYNLSDNNSHIRGFILKFDSNTGEVINSLYLSTSVAGGSMDPKICEIDNNNIVVSGNYKATSMSIAGQAVLANNDVNGFVVTLNASDFLFQSIYIQPYTGSATSSNSFSHIIPTSDGFYVVGHVYSLSLPLTINSRNISVSPTSANLYDFFVIKTDKSFNKQWVVYSQGVGNNHKQIISALLEEDDDLVLAGYNRANSVVFYFFDGSQANPIIVGGLNSIASNNKDDLMLLRLNRTGSIVKSKINGSIDAETVKAIEKVDNNYVIAGNYINKLTTKTNTITNPTANQNSFIAIADNDFNLFDSKTFDKTAGLTDLTKISYNNNDVNYLGALVYTNASINFNLASGPQVVTSGTSKDLLLANTCPFFVDTTSRITYINPSVTATITPALVGYTGSYTSKWSTGATTNILTNVAAGSYTDTLVYVNNKCKKTITYQVINSIKENTPVVSNPASCTSFDGQLAASAVDLSGAGSNFEYSIDSVNWNTTGVFTALPAGRYQVYYRNKINNHVLKGAPVELKVSPADEVPYGTLVATDVNCYNESNGSITASVLPQQAGYELSVDSGKTFTPGLTIANLKANRYQVLVKHPVNGCLFRIAEISINQPDTLIFGLTSATGESCAEYEDGSIGLSATGGSMPYAYEYGLEGNTPSETFASIATNLKPGLYSVRVRDSHGCFSANKSVPISSYQLQTTPNIIPQTCKDIADARVSIQIEGTTPGNYTITLTPEGQSAIVNNTGVFTNLLPGNYSYRVMDGNNCQSLSKFITINASPEFILNDIQITPAANKTSNDGIVVAQVSGGSSMYSFKLTSTGLLRTSSDGYFTSLPVGNYSLTVTDVSCTLTPALTNIDPIEVLPIETSTNELLGNQRAPYPNPVSNLLYLPIDKGMVRLYDLSGRTIRIEQLSSNTLDVSGIEPGYYLLSLEELKPFKIQIVR